MAARSARKATKSVSHAARSASAKKERAITKRPIKERATHPNSSAFPTGMSGPALRALANAGIRSMVEVARWSPDDLAALHGMGPKALRLLAESARRGSAQRR